MYLCYVDESGTPETPGNTSHFVLAGVAIPIWRWKEVDQLVARIKTSHRLKADTELHAAWIARVYKEQSQIAGFERLTDDERRRQVTQWRNQELLRLQRAKNRPLYQRTKKFFKQTEPYIHLTKTQRMDFLRQVGDQIGGLKYAKLFAEAIDKLYHVSKWQPLPVAEQAFEQVISRLEKYLELTKPPQQQNFGLIIHDNNQTVELKHTKLMQKFHQDGTFWIDLKNIIETPMFVNSALTSMVQIADLCSYSIRRFCENGETDLFNRIFPIADRAPHTNKVVGVRHFSKQTCACAICQAHR
ncbi:MAG TPA: DUF3800 domain-containing protein [Burkholderiales bacterium]|nr:DUF3800 domain-containing protein [Burkholderiales bacterium]